MMSISLFQKALREKKFEQASQLVSLIAEKDLAKALYLVCYFDHLDIFKKIIARGANIHSLEFSLLHHTMTQASSNILKYLLQEKFCIPPGALTDACTTSNNNINMIKLLLASHADANERQNGRTPLHAICKSQKSEDMKLMIIALLLKFNANLYAEDAFGDTPVHYASMHGTPAQLQLLFKHANNKNKLVNHEGLHSPLAAALLNNRFDNALFLLNHGADAHSVVDIVRFNPACAETIPPELKAKLRDHGVDPEPLDVNTPEGKDALAEYFKKILEIEVGDLSILKEESNGLRPSPQGFFTRQPTVENPSSSPPRHSPF